MAEPGVCLTDNSLFTNFCLYQNKYIYIANDKLFIDGYQIAGTFGILQFYVVKHRLYCILKDSTILVYNLIHKLVDIIIENGFRTIIKASLINNILYLITDKGKIYESPIDRTQFKLSDFGPFPDKFAYLDRFGYRKGKIVSFDNFVAKDILYTDNHYLLVDIYDRVYMYSTKLELFYHHYFDIVDIKVISSVLYIIDCGENLTIVENIYKMKKQHIRKSRRILSSRLVASLEGVHDASTGEMLLAFKEYNSLYYYDGFLYERKKAERCQSGKSIDSTKVCAKDQA